MQNKRTFKSGMLFTKEEIKNLLKTAYDSKVVSFYTCPRAPFYRETKGLFTSRKYPRIQRIFLVWTCTQNVFYISWFGGLISHIYKPVNSSHVEPRLRVNSMSIETKGYKEYLDSKSLQEYLNSNLKLRTQKTGKYLERLTSIFFVFTSFNSSQVS
jgi:hypothetical protein